ncbi:MarR family winged helix-turn-helix transcriptional regulator [Streptosporangium sp. NPDC000396]|uniref:MarR family winged helix-turn-helix transcriptional regulator n=1 Tax=Streptosporangium sp. NPDC000396 TaxID=3366185 RepID=UPI0036C01BC0
MEELDFGVLLGLAYNQLVDELHTHLDKAGFNRLQLRPAFGYAFRALARESLTTSQLAARLGITPQGAAKTVDEMVAAGFVERVPDPADGRMRRLRLTDHCRSLMAVAREFHAEVERRLAAEFGTEHIAVVRQVLNAIVDRNESPDSLARALRGL